MRVLDHYHSLSLVSDLLILSRRAWQIVAFEVWHQSRVILVVHFFIFFFWSKIITYVSEGGKCVNLSYYRDLVLQNFLVQIY